MRYGKLLYVLVWVAFAAVLIAGYVSGLDTADAQISPRPTPTWTWTPPPPPTNTPTPIPPPTNTPTPIPPTNTPPPPTNTPTPIPIPPTLSNINVNPPDALLEVGTPVDVYASLVMPSITDLETATWDWGDGTASICPQHPTTCAVEEGDGNERTVTGHHIYSLPGVYTIQLTVMDVFGQFDTSTYEFMIVYDSDGGFVTGGGWIDSQAGAYKPDPSLAGKATFGFVSKYKKGSSRPTGNTVFQFKVADQNFHSDSYQWLVVNRDGTRAQFKGDGTINGAPSPNRGNYRFMLWATDGYSSTEVDTFRIRIWYEDSDLETIVYDNGFRQPIGSGNITVHAGKGS